MADTLSDRLRSGVGSSISFGGSEFHPKSLLLLNVLTRRCADRVLKGGRHAFPNLISKGVVAKLYEYLFTCAWCCW